MKCSFILQHLALWTNNERLYGFRYRVVLVDLTAISTHYFFSCFTKGDSIARSFIRRETSYPTQLTGPARETNAHSSTLIHTDTHTHQLFTLYVHTTHPASVAGRCITKADHFLFATGPVLAANGLFKTLLNTLSCSLSMDDLSVALCSANHYNMSCDWFLLL